jgi:translation initiation factor IF-2
MSDTKTPGDKTLHVSPKTLSLPKRPAEQNTVRQSFSHGRSKAVVVETVKRRVLAPGAPKEAAPAASRSASRRCPGTLGPAHAWAQSTRACCAERSGPGGARCRSGSSGAPHGGSGAARGRSGPGPGTCGPR